MQRDKTNVDEFATHQQTIAYFCLIPTDTHFIATILYFKMFIVELLQLPQLPFAFYTKKKNDVP